MNPSAEWWAKERGFLTWSSGAAFPSYASAPVQHRGAIIARAVCLPFPDICCSFGMGSKGRHPCSIAKPSLKGPCFGNGSAVRNWNFALFCTLGRQGHSGLVNSLQLELSGTPVGRKCALNSPKHLFFSLYKWQIMLTKGCTSRIPVSKLFALVSFRLWETIRFFCWDDMSLDMSQMDLWESESLGSDHQDNLPVVI